MNRIHFAIFQGFVFGSIVLFFLSQKITKAPIVFAADTLTTMFHLNQPQDAPTSPLQASAPITSQETGCAISNGYPASIQQWCTSITSAANQHGIDPNLIAAVILVESGGNPQAYSPSGAVGLMQVMPRDGLAAGFVCPNGPCFASRPSMAELYDPDFNINYGVRMLAGLMQRHGNPRDALKSYGPAGSGYQYADKVLSIYRSY
ncbi:MAG: transglycosylase SLT domain-containing protein [Anaerolineae bacterium]|nr:transglycosylase SLT domain-containing protein [Anaerolineae bacterium]